MKKLLLKILLLVLLVGGANGLLSLFFYDRIIPFYWGNQGMTDKRNYLAENRDSINVLFLGSSKTYHQINPLLFDSLVGNNQEVRSFNFGIQGMLPPESIYLYEHLLRSDSLKVKYVLMELDWFDNVKPGNLHSRRSYYLLNRDYYRFALQAVFDSNVPIHLKLWALIARSINYAEKLYNFGLVHEYFKYRAAENESTHIDLATLEKYRGYVPLKTKAHSKKTLAEIKAVRLASESSFAKHTRIRQREYSETFLRKIQELINLSEQRGIHLIVFMPPLWKNYQYDEIIPLFRQIDPAHKIELADYRKYPTIFDPQKMFDADHVNKVGAEDFTRILAEQFRAIQERQMSEAVVR